ncbi:DTW domain-containing protein 1 isoform X2 [Nannospalax galili]|uniref:DTW domain-containing protein 1 isoform X2 n=1 Tax=Nannospalax galili TaxID=1026970 RepID=UPI00111C76D9|nr:DTW domain-containing protein 1 isoform X2 [Nannospalax galili]
MALSPSVCLQECKENNAKFVEAKQSQTAFIASEDPLQNLCLASQDILHKAQQSGRSRCLQCGGSRMFYCYTCYVPVGNVPTEQIPLVKLPLKIDIIKHPNETDGKSTAVHAKLLAPDCVNIYTYPCIPEYEERDHEVVLVFPGPQSISVKDISFYLQKRIENKGRGNNGGPDKPSLKRKRTEEEESCDLTENKCKGLLQVELKTRKTCFWRHQKGKPDTFLSTIEAIYYFLVDYHTELLREKYRGQYDNLLFFYSFMYRLVKNAKGAGGKGKTELTH